MSAIAGLLNRPCMRGVVLRSRVPVEIPIPVGYNEFPKWELLPRVRVSGRDKLDKFKRKHPDARGPLNAWEAEVRSAKWPKWADIKAVFPAASWLENGRVVFDIKGNYFRLVVRIHFGLGQVLVERIGTHAEYSKWQLKQGKP